MKFTRKNKLFSLVQFGIIALLILNLVSLPIMASSHAEAPLISMDRYADNTDVYAFRSTEPGRQGFVTLIANYIPFQDPSGGPQFYRFDDSVMYEIKIDNTGDGLEDITYQFQFTTQIVRPSTVLGMNTLNQDGVIANERGPDVLLVLSALITCVPRRLAVANTPITAPGAVELAGIVPVRVKF